MAEDNGSARLDFASDNASGVTRPILDALVAASGGAEPAYGSDSHSARAEALLAATFDHDLAAFFVATGTAANALALGAFTPPWGAVFCHEDSHISEDECGAPELLTGGAKLVGIAGSDGKITADALATTLTRFPRGIVKQVQPAMLSLSQATESGTVYDLNEIERLSRAAHAAGMMVHMDGARFANALIEIGCTPAQMTWKAGIDVLSFGATKNGALACEAVVFFDPARAANFAFQRKRAGHTLSKGRLLGAQMYAYLDGDHWLATASHANAMAQRLEMGLRAMPGVRLPWVRQANEVFAILPRTADARLKALPARYYEWSARCLPAGDTPGADEVFIRLVTSFSTRTEDVDRLLAAARGES